MPSDDRELAMRAAFVATAHDYVDALGETAEEVRRYVIEQNANMNGRSDRLSAQLGPFGATYIDADKFAALFHRSPHLTSSALDTVDQALTTIYELKAHSDSLISATVPPGGDLHDTIDHALAGAGRAFGAAHVVHAVRSGRYHLREHARSLGSYPFTKWNRAERRLAPPLLVFVQGNDVRAASLAEFMDGRVKIVLIVDGRCTPAPLVRLITPGTYVVQSTDVRHLSALATFNGPGIGALVPEGCAEFVHDPKAGPSVSQRITITVTPEQKHRKAIGGLSSDQQNEEIQLLESLATSPATSVEATRPTSTTQAPPDPVDKLAAWLISQADMTGIE